MQDQKDAAGLPPEENSVRKKKGTGQRTSQGESLKKKRAGQKGSVTRGQAMDEEYRALRRKYLMLEEESFALRKELMEVENEVKALEDEKFELLDELVVLEGLLHAAEIRSKGLF
ncbi:unnamed protein product [Cuscuta campestris]|uniref:Uncharacterized protein n=2 Tax=Cuscuta sect. Cleistogrammica TaxID=1824901 RepID=A0A484NFT1_9ASTE|nr:hypothetical protein DM860_004714 [Cuscuta australis]VFQ99763.1 unnamed protein product [Cuscuta campestris]